MQPMQLLDVAAARITCAAHHSHLALTPPPPPHPPLQVLIVLHFLQNPMPIPPQQAAVWQLKPKQVPEVEALKARVLGCLAATPGDGDALAASVRAALAHEGFWTLWKAGPSAAQAGGVYSGKPDTAAERWVAWQAGRGPRA